MPNPPPISIPAGFAPAFALGFSDAQTNLTMVSQTAPLPVTMQANAAPAPLSGQTGISTVAGPYIASPGVPINVALSGVWTGTAQLLRSTDNGVTKLPLLIGGSAWGTFSESGAEQAWVESELAVSFYLSITLTSGTLAYRVSQ